MTSEELAQAIDALNVSHAEMARILGVEYRSIMRYLSGDRSIPEPTARLIRLLVKRPKLIDEIRPKKARSMVDN